MRHFAALVAVAALALLVTCDPLPQGAAPPTEPGRVALLAVGLDALPGPLVASLRVDGETVAELTLPAAPEALEGAATWSLAADDRPVQLAVDVRRDGVLLRGRTLGLTPEDGQVHRLEARLDGRGAVVLTPGQDGRLQAEVGATVDYRDTARGQAWLPRLGPQPAAAVAAILADPAIAVLTPVAASHSSADTIGPLVAFRPVAREATPAPTAVASATAPERRAPDPLAAPTLAGDSAASSAAVTHIARPAPAARRAETRDAQAVIPAWMRYYSYCTCGKPVTDQPYTLTTASGRRQEGRTDRHGMVLSRALDVESLNFGPSQRARTRSYAFIEGNPDTRVSMLRALDSADPNEALTAMLDLRAQPLPEARDKLVALLAHPSPVFWRNAAMTLSFYSDGPEAALAAMGPRPETTAVRRLTTLGALRHPSAVDELADALADGDTEAKVEAAWALGFIGHPRGLEPLLNAARDASPGVRAEVALALGRIADAAAIETLEQLQGDAVPSVSERAREAIALLDP